MFSVKALGSLYFTYYFLKKILVDYIKHLTDAIQRLGRYEAEFLWFRLKYYTHKRQFIFMFGVRNSLYHVNILPFSSRLWKPT